VALDSHFSTTLVCSTGTKALNSKLWSVGPGTRPFGGTLGSGVHVCIVNLLLFVALSAVCQCCALQGFLEADFGLGRDHSVGLEPCRSLRAFSVTRSEWVLGGFVLVREAGHR
jgi:hypothetical protein